MRENLAIAVVMSVKEGADSGLALSAVNSTLRALGAQDRIFLMVDGGNVLATESLRELATCGRLIVHYSPKRSGLAASLNKLIDIVLGQQDWALFARMDADDECLPSRFDCQRRFLIEHPDIDILGSRCREVDENGTHLRTKALPRTHDEIVRSLPKRNPLNHPTVMLRRCVFESGLRYRPDIGLVEDWHLWIDAAAKEFRFANLEQVFLNFRRSNDFFDKRGGWKQAAAEWRVRRHARRALGQSSLGNFSYAIAASALRLMPAKIQASAYRLAN